MAADELRGLQDGIEDLPSEQFKDASRRIRVLEEVLIGSDASKTGDPLVDMWEAQIARGETPDLERTST